MLDWIQQNSEWLFSGAGVALILFLTSKFTSIRKSDGENNIIINNANTIEQSHSSRSLKTQGADVNPKTLTRILFIDDDTKFKVVRILKNDGWNYVRIVKDISSLTSPELIEADILFVDIHGVGKELSFSDEGLGLAYAIKQKYPKKKVIIYSTESTGERFHRALQKADYSLPKNADPYEFIRLVEEFSEEAK